MKNKKSILLNCLVISTVAILFISVGGLLLRNKIPQQKFLQKKQQTNTSQEVSDSQPQEIEEFQIAEITSDLTFPDVEFDYIQEVIVNFETDEEEPDNEDGEAKAKKDETLLKDHVFCFSLSISHLYQNAGFVFSPENLVLFNSDKKTTLPYWIQDDYKNEILVFTRVPNYSSTKPITLYFVINQSNEYPSIDSNYAFSNFNSVFVQKETSLIGWYSFLQSNVVPQLAIPDFSGNGNDGNLSNFEPSGFIYPSYDIPYGSKEHKQVYFAKWLSEENPMYFQLPLKGESTNFSQKGSIEMWIDHRDGKINVPGYYNPIKNLLLLTNAFNNFTLRYIKDTFLFTPSNEDTTVSIPWNPENNELFQIILTWDFYEKTCSFFINGQKQKIDLTPLSNWNEVTPLSEIHFLGSEPAVENDFGGNCLGIYLYNKALSVEESSKETKLHNPEYLYENAILSSFGGSYKQELIGSMEAPMSDIIQFSTFYSTPMHSYGSFLVPDTNIKKFLALSPKNKNRSIDMIFSNFDRITPIFGMPTHFYNHQGTPIKVSKPCFVNYVKLKINDPELLSEFIISFSYEKVLYSSIQGTTNSRFGKSDKNPKTIWYNLKQKINSFCPSAFACGPYYTYKDYGKSTLELLFKQGDSYYYKLKNPIYIDEKAEFMQLDFKPNSKGGFLSIELEDILFEDDSNETYKGTKNEFEGICSSLSCWSNEWNEKTKKFDYFYLGEPKAMYFNYEALLVSEEKGAITLETINDKKTLALRFHNIGEHTIHIDSDSIKYIQQNAYADNWNTINILPADEDTYFYEFTIRKSCSEILEKIKGKEILPNEYIDVPFISFKELSKNEHFKNSPFIGIKFLKYKKDKTPNHLKTSAKADYIIIWDGKIHLSDYTSNTIDDYERIPISKNGEFTIPSKMKIPLG